MNLQDAVMWAAVGTFIILVVRTAFSQAKQLLVEPLVTNMNNLEMQLSMHISELSNNIKMLNEALGLLRDGLTDVRERMAINEQATKSLHKRVDNVEKRIDNIVAGEK